MALCGVLKGRLEACKDTLGGLLAVYFANYAEADGAFTVVSKEVTAIGVGLTTVYKYDLTTNTSSFDEALIGSKDNGTRVNTQTLNIVLTKQDVATHGEIDSIVAGRPVVIVRDRNNKYHVAGITQGMETTGSAIGTGSNSADFNGYNITLTAQEGSLAPLLDSATITALEALVDATPIDPNA